MPVIEANRTFTYRVTHEKLDMEVLGNKQSLSTEKTARTPQF